MNVDPLAPRYAQPEVLRVTGLRPVTLQTWINRKAIELAEQNPGTGRRRLYSEIDVVKLAIMRRLGDLSVELSASKRVAEIAAEHLLETDAFDWELALVLTPRASSAPRAFSMPNVGGTELEAKFTALFPDHQSVRVINSSFAAYTLASLAEVSDSVAPYRYKRDPWGGSEPFAEPDLEGKSWWARRGLHAEPFIFIPLGEIVHGTLAQLAALDEARAEQDVSP